ncbi:MAG: hypothetical protein ACU85E_06435 [Gammaproteobacteria bacterium]
MKQLQKLAGVLILMSFSAVVYSQEPSMEEGMKQPGMKMHKGKMGMMGKMGGMTEEQKDQHMRAMQEHMLMMHELSDKIIAEKDPAKKQALKDQQLEMMKAHRAQMMGHLQKMREQ